DISSATGTGEVKPCDNTDAGATLIFQKNLAKARESTRTFGAGHCSDGTRQKRFTRFLNFANRFGTANYDSSDCLVLTSRGKAASGSAPSGKPMPRGLLPCDTAIILTGILSFGQKGSDGVLLNANGSCCMPGSGLEDIERPGVFPFSCPPGRLALADY